MTVKSGNPERDYVFRIRLKRQTLFNREFSRKKSSTSSEPCSCREPRNYNEWHRLNDCFRSCVVTNGDEVVESSQLIPLCPTLASLFTCFDFKDENIFRTSSVPFLFKKVYCIPFANEKLLRPGKMTHAAAQRS